MLCVILNDALQFAATPDLASVLLAGHHFSAVAVGVVARRTLRAVWIWQLGSQIYVSAAFVTPSGTTSFQTVILSASDDVVQKLRPLLLGGIVELFVLPTDALADQTQQFRWFVDVLRGLVVGGVVSRTLRLPLSNDASVDSIYSVVERFHYVKAVEVHYDDARRLDFDVVDHEAHRAKCDGLGIRQVQFFEKGVLNVPRELPLEFNRIVALLEASASVGMNAGRPVDSLFATYHKEFNEDISEPEKLCRVLALREDDVQRILQRYQDERQLGRDHSSTFVAIFENARPSVLDAWRGNVYLRQGYQDTLAKWKQGWSA